MKGKDITNPERPVKKLCTHNVLIDFRRIKSCSWLFYVYVKTIFYILFYILEFLNFTTISNDNI